VSDKQIDDKSMAAIRRHTKELADPGTPFDRNSTTCCAGGGRHGGGLGWPRSSCSWRVTVSIAAA